MIEDDDEDMEWRCCWCEVDSVIKDVGWLKYMFMVGYYFIFQTKSRIGNPIYK